MFFWCLVPEKISASEALHRFISVIRESPGHNDMKYWAPFVLLGENVKSNFGWEVRIEISASFEPHTKVLAVTDCFFTRVNEYRSLASIL